MKLTSFVEQHLTILINWCGLLQMVSYRKQLAVVAERIHCIGQETER